MANPSSRQGLIDYCLRELGHPVIEINVDDDQVEDRIEEALAYYHDYHFDGTQKVYLAHQVTAEDKTNKYITIPEAVIGIINIFDVGDSFSTNNLFNIRYQIALNDLFAFNYGPFAPYYMALQNVALAEELFVGRQSLRYNRHVNRLYIDMDWEAKIATGEYIIVEAICHPIHPSMFQDLPSGMLQ